MTRDKTKSNIAVRGFSMFAFLFLVAGTMGSSQLPSLTLPAPVTAEKPLHVPGQVLVEFEQGISQGRQEQTLSAVGLHSIQTATSNISARSVRLQTGVSVAAAVAQYNAMPGVKSAQPNFYYYPSAVPNDPLYPQQWGLSNSMQAITNGGTSLNNPPAAMGADMNLPGAWDVRASGNCGNVVVAVIDSGINRTHDDLDDNMWTNVAEINGNGMDDDGNGYIDDFYGWDFIGNDNDAANLNDQDNDPLPFDGSGHGTHVAGTIGAEGNNGIAGSGVCWNVQIMALRALSDTAGTTVTIVPAINYAVANGAKVINMSLGGSGLDPAMAAAIENARQQGVVVIAAAGNNGINNDVTPLYPCNLSTSHNNVVCVATLDQAYARSSFSNFGAASVNVGAPGTNVLSTWPAPANELFDNTWTYVNGGATGWARSANCPVFSDGIGTLTLNSLTNPANWCVNPAAAAYANNQTDRVYKGLDLSLSGEVHLETLLFHDLGAGDVTTVAFDTGAGANPFDGANDAVLEQFTGSSAGALLSRRYNLAGCNVANCGIGLQFTSDAAGVATGTSLIVYSINAVEKNSRGTRVIQGTSMAAPHVSGLAALLIAHNPSYSYLNVIDSIENAGDTTPSLASNTTSGKAVDANQSLLYITAPTGLSSTVVLN